MTTLSEYLKALPSKVLTTFYRRLAVVIRPLDDIPTAPPSQPTNLRLLTPQDAEAYYRLQPHYYPPGVFQARLAHGEQCFGVFADDQLTHVGWGTVKPNYAPYLQRDLVPSPGDVISFNNYTRRDYRKHGFSAIRTNYLFQYYRSRGSLRAIGLVAVENAVGARVAEDVGYTGIGLFSCLRLGPWQWDWQKAWTDQPLPKLVKPTGPAAIRNPRPPFSPS